MSSLPQSKSQPRSQPKPSPARSLPRVRTARERIAANRQRLRITPLHIVCAVALLAIVAAYLTLAR